MTCLEYLLHEPVWLYYSYEQLIVEYFLFGCCVFLQPFHSPCRALNGVCYLLSLCFSLQSSNHSFTRTPPRPRMELIQSPPPQLWEGVDRQMMAKPLSIHQTNTCAHHATVHTGSSCNLNRDALQQQNWWLTDNYKRSDSWNGVTLLLCATQKAS